MHCLQPFLTWILNRHHQFGAVTEIRALRKMPDGGQMVWSGYFGPEQAQALALGLLPKGRTPRRCIPPGGTPFIGEANFYFSMQGVDLSRVDGTYGRIIRSKRTTRDADIAVYTLFAVDLDPIRPSGMAATADEKAAAALVADRVTAWLGERGIRPLRADSGNGYHLLIPVKPIFGADVAKASLKAHTLLQLLDARFSNADAKVDTGIFNPSRILKLYGTLAMKGESTEERPHRLASVDLTHIPADVDLFGQLGDELRAFTASRVAGRSASVAVAVRKSVRPRSDASKSDSIWQVWREFALKALPLETVYGRLLTGKASGDGWLQCRDPDSPSGDQNPSAGVADGTGDAERGTFHSFRTGESLSVFDYLVQHGGLSDFKAAREHIAKLSGVPCPTPLNVKEKVGMRIPALDQLDVELKALAEKSREVRRVATGLGGSIVNPPAEPEPGERCDVSWITNVEPVSSLFNNLVAALKPFKRLFNSDSGLVWVQPGSGPMAVSERQLPGLISSVIDIHFHRVANDQLRLSRIGVLPYDLARSFVVDPRVRESLPRLGLYTRAPLFASGWQFIGTRGFHPVDGGIWYDGETVNPSPQNTKHLDPLLGAFHWHTPADRVNAIGVMLTALTLPHWGRGHPFVAITANKPGAGKTTLARILGVLAEGREPATVTWTSDDAELEKQLATRVDAGDRFIILDNVKTRGALCSAVLERSITDGRSSFRRLGTNNTITRRRNDLLFCLTMNDTRLGPDLRRRALPINLLLETDAKQVRYPIDDIVGYALEHRTQLLAELAGKVQGWLDAGRPYPTNPAEHSTSQQWARTIDAILQHAGCKGFLSNIDRAERAFDPELDLLADIITLYAESPPAFAAEWAIRLEGAGIDDLFKDRLGREKSARGKATAVGRLFASRLGEVIRVEEREGRCFRLTRSWPRGEGWKAVYAFEEVG